MLKHLGPNGIRFLTSTFNGCINQSDIPPIWKVGRIIPLLKPKKPQDQGPSYRPISLLSPAAKILECLVLVHLQEAVPLADHQHGFRKGRSTTTALLDIVNHIKSGLNRTKPVERTVLVAVDLSRAFDTVDHAILINDIAALDLNITIKRFLVAYLRGRQTFVEFRGKRSKCRKMRQGVPQGGVLSPTLFNLYMSPMPTPPPKVKLTTYADDGSVMARDKKIQPICDRLNPYLDTLNTWFKQRNLFISPAKSSATVFTTWSNECSIDLPIFIDGVKVPTVKDPKILGVTLDPLLTFRTHAQNIKKKLTSRNNVLKALAGSTWGMEKEVLLTTYKAISKPLINYCAPIWTPTLCDSQWQELQACQNLALRTALGCTKMTSVDHLHAESLVMPAKAHNEMLSKQFLLRTKLADHPNKQDADDIPLHFKRMKPTLQSKFEASIQHLAPNNPNEIEYNAVIKAIHSSCVTEAI